MNNPLISKVEREEAIRVTRIALRLYTEALARLDEWLEKGDTKTAIDFLHNIAQIHAAFHAAVTTYLLKLKEQG